MKTRKFTILLVSALSVLAIAGVKVSQLTRTRSLQSTSRFMVSTQDASSGRWSSRYITAPDLATNLGPWITNNGGGGTVTATNAVTETNANQFLGVPLAIKSGSTETNKQLYPASISASAVTINALQFQSADVMKVKDSLGNDMFTIGADGALLVNGNITAAAGDLSSSGNMTIGGTADITGSATFGSNVRADGELQLGNKRIKITIGNGSPEGVVTANPQSIYLNTNQTAGIGLYLKTNGTSSAGWWLLTGDITRSEYSTDIGNLQAATNSHNTRITALESGGSGTNQPVTLTAGSLALIASQTARYYTNSSGSFPFIFNGTPNASAIITLGISNSSASVIYATNTSGIYDPTVASNVTTFAIAPQSQRNMRFIRNATGGWELDGQIAKEYELAPGSGVTFSTNGSTISVVSPTGFNYTNVYISTTNEVSIDVSAFDVAKVYLLTNLNTLTLTNVSSMIKRAQIYFQQDTNGSRTIGNNRVAGGLLQTNGSLALTSTANALDVLEILPGFFSTNAVAWWPQNFQPRVAFTNSLAIQPFVYMLNEGFEGAGYENTSPNAWAESGNVDEDATDGVSAGSQNVSVQRIGGTSTTTIYLKNSGSGTNQPDLGIYFTVKTTSTNINGSIVNLTTNNTVKNIFGMRTTGRVRLYSSDGVINASPAEGFPANAITHVWLDITNSNGSGAIEFATSNTRLRSGTKYATYTGAQTGIQINGIQLIADTALQTNAFDYLRVHTNSLNSAPE